MDFEFDPRGGEPPEPVGLVAHELRSKQTVALWEDELRQRREAPYRTDARSLFAAYYASAELSCHLRLGWPLPLCILDLYAELRTPTNGLELPCGSGLLGALASYGLGAMGVLEKEAMRERALRGGPWSEAERTALLAYCKEDVLALQRLLSRMASRVDLPRALLRGRSMAAAARIEAVGAPWI